jgi:hypothetical protein
MEGSACRADAVLAFDLVSKGATIYDNPDKPLPNAKMMLQRRKVCSSEDA